MAAVKHNITVSDTGAYTLLLISETIGNDSDLVFQDRTKTIGYLLITCIHAYGSNSWYQHISIPSKLCSSCHDIT